MLQLTCPEHERAQEPSLCGTFPSLGSPKSQTHVEWHKSTFVGIELQTTQLITHGKTSHSKLVLLFNTSLLLIGAVGACLKPTFKVLNPTITAQGHFNFQDAKEGPLRD
jgi:hypothetical protein